MIWTPKCQAQDKEFSFFWLNILAALISRTPSCLLQRDRIPPGKAAVTEATGGIRGNAFQGIQAQKAQAVRADLRPNFFDGIAAGNELLSAGDVGAEPAGGDKRGRRGAQVNLPGPRIPQEGHDLPGGSAPDDGVIHQHHPPILHAAFQRPQLDPHRLLPVFLAGGDKGAADIAVLYQPHPVGDTGLLGIAHGGVQAGVRNANNCQRRFEIVRKRRRNFVVFRRGG